jgi:hypothetical protein
MLCFHAGSIVPTYVFSNPAKQEYANPSALWLTWYANGTITSFSLFAIIYIVAAVLALGGMTSIFWFGSPNLP